MSASGQALVWDADRAEYTLVKAGDPFQEFTVAAVEPEHVLLADPRRTHIRYILALPDSSAGAAVAQVPLVTHRSAEPAAEAPLTAHRSAEPAVEAPLTAHRSAEPTAEALELADPYASYALALVDPYAAYAPGRGPAPTPGLAGPGVSSSAVPGAGSSGPAGSAAQELAHHTVRIARAEINQAVANLETLLQQVQLEPDSGAVRIAGLASDSLPYRAGLRAGDRVVAVGGERRLTIDTAARLYGRLQSADRFDVEVERNGQRIVISYLLVDAPASSPPSTSVPASVPGKSSETPDASAR
jgi:hypothetical protein